jgi:hypothetical protein
MSKGTVFGYLPENLTGTDQEEVDTISLLKLSSARQLRSSDNMAALLANGPAATDKVGPGHSMIWIEATEVFTLDLISTVAAGAWISAPVSD